MRADGGYLICGGIGKHGLKEIVPNKCPSRSLVVQLVSCTRNTISDRTQLSSKVHMYNVQSKNLVAEQEQ